MPARNCPISTSSRDQQTVTAIPNDLILTSRLPYLGDSYPETRLVRQWMQFLLSWCLRDSNLRQSSATIGIAVGAPFANHWTELAVVSIPQVLRPLGPPPPAPRHGQLQPTIRDLGPCTCDLLHPPRDRPATCCLPFSSSATTMVTKPTPEERSKSRVRPADDSLLGPKTSRRRVSHISRACNSCRLRFVSSST